jgi:hypothetical protein
MERTCENCEKFFIWNEVGTGRFCNIKCARGFSTKFKRKEINEKVARKLTLEDNPRITDKICKKCKKKFKGIEKRKFCSRKCFLETEISLEHRKKLSSSLKGKTGGYRVKSGTGKKYGGYYREIWLDSSWEIKFAQNLDAKNIKWERPTVGIFYTDIYGNRKKYYPDFFIPEKNQFVEIKGYNSPQSKFKLESVIKEHKINLIVLDNLEKISGYG